MSEYYDNDEVAQAEARAAAIEANMIAEGLPTREPIAVDYFGFDETHRVMLPDGVSWIDHKVLTEGARRKYLNKVNRDVRIQKASGDAIMRIATGDEKAALLSSAICGWNLSRGGQPVPFNDRNLSEFLDKASPKIIDLIHKDIAVHNNWLNADVTIEDIDKEIAELQELRQRKLDEEQGKVGSVNK